jgi:purine-nucleoside phosphorylase
VDRRHTEPTTASVPEDAYAAAAADGLVLSERLGPHRAALVLGSGWAGVGHALGTVGGEFAMDELAGVPAPTVPGHGGTVASVDVDGNPVLVLTGRSHLYEGHPVATVVHAVRAAVLSGCTAVLLTNAAGSLRSDVGVGRAVVISDQLNLTGANPLCGPEPPGPPGNRFADLTALYSPRLRAAALAHDATVTDGVYAGLVGGSFETPAEIRMLRTMGADLVGMSTVLEAIAAHHLGAEVFGVSLVTNLAAGMSADLDHQEVLAAGVAAEATLVGLLRTVVGAL